MKLPNITLTTQQTEAVEKIVMWYHFWNPGKKVGNDQIFYLSGYAGTGKTTIVPFVMDGLNIDPSQVVYGTFTGIAARVLSEKSGKVVSTVHSLCYELVDEIPDEKTGKVELVWRLRKNSPAASAKLIVLDEVSMLSKAMMTDLMSFGVPILCFGDNFQLDAIDGDSYFNTREPDFFLSEIHRQSLENPIIWLSKHVREGNDVDFGSYSDSVHKIPRGDATEEMWLDASQVICGTNKTRRACNRWFRDALGYSDVNSIFPVTGERMICLKNRWDSGLVNGSQLIVTANAKVSADREKFKLSFTTMDGNTELKFTNLECSAHEIHGRPSSLPWWEVKKLLPVDYAYTATTHKMQGSQCERVLFIDEGFGRWANDNTYYRHLYTSITRAVSGLIIIQ